MPTVCAEMTNEMAGSAWSWPRMCRDVMTITSTITIWPSIMASSATSAAG